MPGLSARTYCSLLMALSFAWIANGSLSAQAQDLAQVPVTLKVKKVTYEAFIDSLERVTGCNFVYSPDELPTDRLLTASFSQKPFGKVLEKVFEKSGFSCEIDAMSVLLILAEPLDSPPGSCTLSGKVFSEAGHETLIGATVSIVGTTTGVAANHYGYYSLTLPAGEYDLAFNYLGHQALRKTVLLTADTYLDITLKESAVRLQEVTVKGKQDDLNVKLAQMSAVRMTQLDIQQVPKLFGESDVVRAIQLLPGVQSTGEGTAGMVVRGGGTDQNLVLLDDAPIYNASHILGFFSVFNPDAVQEAELFKGGMPARYGGRLSSVLDIRMREGDRDRLRLSGGIGTIASRLTLEGPVAKGKGSFLLSARRTYLDALLRAVSSGVFEQNSLFFIDVNGKFAYDLGEKDKVLLTAYWGRDRVGLRDYYSVSWGNLALSAKWNHVYHPKVFGETTVSYSAFDSRTEDNLIASLGTDLRYDLNDLTLKKTVSYYAKPEHELRFGYEGTFHRFSFGRIEPLTSSSVIDEERLKPVYAIASALFVSHEAELGDKVSLHYGLRYSRFDNLGPGRVYKYDRSPVVSPETDFDQDVTDTLDIRRGDVYSTYQGFEPRISMRYQAFKSTAFKVSYNRTRQYLHQLSNANVPTPVDMWAPVNRHVKPQISDQVAAGVFQNLFDNAFEVSLEAYYKYMDNQIDFKPFSDLVMNDHFETEVLVGEGRAYGLELLVKKRKGALTGWLTYTWTRSDRQIPGINDGQVYASSFDRRHNAALVLSFSPNKRFNLTANWVYASGVAYTVPAGKYSVNGLLIPYYESRNNFRLPDTHRLDLSMTLYRKMDERKKNESSINFSIYNVYARRNPYAFVFRESEENPGQTETVKVFLFRVVPSFTYSFKF